MSHPPRASFISEGGLQVQKNMWKNMCHYVFRRERGKQTFVSKMIHCLSLAFCTLSERQIWGGEVDLLAWSTCRVSVISLSLQTLPWQGSRVEWGVVLDTTINFIILSLSFSNIFFHGGRQLHISTSSAIGGYNPRAPAFLFFLRLSYLFHWNKGSQITTLPSNVKANPVPTAGALELTNYSYILLAIR